VIRCRCVSCMRYMLHVRFMLHMLLPVIVMQACEFNSHPTSTIDNM